MSFIIYETRDRLICRKRNHISKYYRPTKTLSTIIQQKTSRYNTRGFHSKKSILYGLEDESGAMNETSYLVNLTGENFSFKIFVISRIFSKIPHSFHFRTKIPIPFPPIHLCPTRNGSKWNLIQSLRRLVWGRSVAVAVAGRCDALLNFYTSIRSTIFC